MSYTGDGRGREVRCESHVYNYSPSALGVLAGGVNRCKPALGCPCCEELALNLGFKWPLIPAGVAWHIGTVWRRSHQTASKGVDFNRVEASNLNLLNITERWRSPVDRTALEMLRSGNTTVGSNPTLSAT